jgi:hypothetical protein
MLHAQIDHGKNLDLLINVRDIRSLICHQKDGDAQYTGHPYVPMANHFRLPRGVQYIDDCLQPQDLGKPPVHSTAVASKKHIIPTKICHAQKRHGQP